MTKKLRREFIPGAVLIFASAIRILLRALSIEIRIFLYKKIAQRFRADRHLERFQALCCLRAYAEASPSATRWRFPGHVLAGIRQEEKFCARRETICRHRPLLFPARQAGRCLFAHCVCSNCVKILVLRKGRQLFLTGAKDI